MLLLVLYILANTNSNLGCLINKSDLEECFNFVDRMPVSPNSIELQIYIIVIEPQTKVQIKTVVKLIQEYKTISVCYVREYWD